MGAKGKHPSTGDLFQQPLAGHNLRMILRAIRLFYVWILYFYIANTHRRQSLHPKFRYFAVL